MRNGILANEKCKFLINRFLSDIKKKNLKILKKKEQKTRKSILSYSML